MDFLVSKAKVSQCTPLCVADDGGGRIGQYKSRNGPIMSLAAPVFSTDLNGYRGCEARMTRPGREKTHAKIIGIGVSKDTSDAY